MPSRRTPRNNGGLSLLGLVSHYPVGGQSLAPRAPPYQPLSGYRLSVGYWGLPSSMAMCLRARGSQRACLKKAGSVLRARAGRKNSSNAPLPMFAGAPYPHLLALAASPLSHRLGGVLQSLRVFRQACQHRDPACGQRWFRPVSKWNHLACAERRLFWIGVGQNSHLSGMAPSFMATIVCQALLPIWELQETLPCRLPQRPWEEVTGPVLWI